MEAPPGDRRVEREQYINLAATRWARRQPISGTDGRGRALNPTIGQRILLELAFTADAKGVSLLGQAALADACLCGERVVRAWMKAFEAAGMISRAKRSLRTGGRTSDCIRLSLTDAPRLSPDSDLWAQRKRRPAPVTGRLPSEPRDSTGKAQTAPGAGTQTAPGAGTQTAPGAKPNGARRRLLNTDNIKPSLPPLEKPEAAMAIRDQLTDIGVQPEMAETIVGAFVAGGTPLDAESAPKLLKMLDGPDPQRSALEMLKDGLGMMVSGRSPGADRDRQVSPTQRYVNSDSEPELWQRCCQATGHKLTLKDFDGGWRFDADVVATAEAEL